MLRACCWLCTQGSLLARLLEGPYMVLGIRLSILWKRSANLCTNFLTPGYYIQIYIFSIEAYVVCAPYGGTRSSRLLQNWQGLRIHMANVVK